MQERHPIKLDAKLVEQEDGKWQAAIVIRIESWLGAGESEILVGSGYANREAALAACMGRIAGFLSPAERSGQTPA